MAVLGGGALADEENVVLVASPGDGFELLPSTFGEMEPCREPGRHKGFVVVAQTSHLPFELTEQRGRR